MFRPRVFLLAIGLLAGCSRPREILVHALVKAAPGLKPGARVQYRGVDVGSVKSVGFTDAGVRIDLLIERRDAPLRRLDQVRVRSLGTFAEQVVEVVPGDSTAPLIAKGASLSAAPSDTLATVTDQLTKAIAEAVDKVVERDSTGTLRVRQTTAIQSSGSPRKGKAAHP